ncbi:MAG TPA: mycofactocin biosynthesis peptidyl-dipeptidase MftE, partial [Pseudonocardiaceae bacterium]
AEIAAELARRLEAARPHDVALAPPVPYGASGEHAAFPGTLSIGREATERLLTELIRSADAFAAVLLVNGHGGNHEPATRAVATARREGRNAHLWWPPAGDAHAGNPQDAHAGHTETSVMLALRPSAVRRPHAVAGRVEPLAELLPALRAHGTRQVSPSGVLGDPRGATADHGRRTLDRWTAELLAAAHRVHPDPGVVRGGPSPEHGPHEGPSRQEGR